MNDVRSAWDLITIEIPAVEIPIVQGTVSVASWPTYGVEDYRVWDVEHAGHKGRRYFHEYREKEQRARNRQVLAGALLVGFEPWQHLTVLRHLRGKNWWEFTTSYWADVWSLKRRVRLLEAPSPPGGTMRSHEPWKPAYCDLIKET